MKKRGSILNREMSIYGKMVFSKKLVIVAAAALFVVVLTMILISAVSALKDYQKSHPAYKAPRVADCIQPQQTHIL